MKNKLFLFFLSLFLSVLIVLFSSSIILYKNKENNITLIGNPLKTNISCNQTFTSEFMDSSYLLKLVKNDASKKIGSKITKLSKLIKSSKTIIINIGYCDIDNLISQKDNELIYDIQIIERQKSILLSNISQIFKLIKHTNNKVKIYIQNLNYSYLINDEYLKTIFSYINSSFETLNNKT